jgi:signal transduction histidine kinase
MAMSMRVNSMAADVVRSHASDCSEAGPELGRLRRDFLDLTVHELRRPLGLASSYLSLLIEGALGDLPRTLLGPLGQMSAAVREMTTLVEGLAAVSRLEDRTQVLDRAYWRLAPLVASAVEAVRPDTKLKKIAMEVHLPPPSLEVRADRDRLRIVLVNLLSNAVKYAPEGSKVTVRAEEGPGTVTIAVRDQGPGIEPRDAVRLFDRHQRGAYALRTPGLGLGLYIVRRIVELHEGQVTVDSQPGQGSTFTIRLPVE